MAPHAQPIYEVKANLFRVLGHPARVRILELLRDGERSVGALQAELGLDSGGTSQHLAALKDAGLVNGRREGRCVYYRVEPRGMKPLIDWIAHYRAFWAERIDRLERLLEEMDE